MSRTLSNEFNVPHEHLRFLSKLVDCIKAKNYLVNRLETDHLGNPGEWERPVLGELADLAAQIDDPKAEALFTTAAKSLDAWGPEGRAVEALAKGAAPWCTRRLEERAMQGDTDAARLLAERSPSSPPATGPSAPAAAAPPPGR